MGKNIQYCKNHKLNYFTSSHAWSKLTPLKRLQQNKIKFKKTKKTRRDMYYTEVPKNLPSLVRARRKGFFGESVG